VLHAGVVTRKVNTSETDSNGITAMFEKETNESSQPVFEGVMGQTSAAKAVKRRLFYGTAEAVPLHWIVSSPASSGHRFPVSFEGFPFPGTFFVKGLNRNSCARP
jgi:hypothetical protein